MVVSDGHTVFRPIQPTFAPGVEPHTVAGCLAQYFLPSHQLDLGFNILVIRKGNQVILFDAGCSHLFGIQAGRLQSNLQLAGIAPEAVTAILLTHAHLDYLSGLLQPSGEPPFINATIYISEREYQFWQAPDFSQSKAPEVEIRTMITHAQQTLHTLQGSIQLFANNTTLFDYIHLRLAPGHTISTIYSIKGLFIAVVAILCFIGVFVIANELRKIKP